MDAEDSGNIDNVGEGNSSSLRRTRSGSSTGFAGGADNIADRMDKSLAISPSAGSRRTNSIYIAPFLSTVKARAATNVDVTDMNSALYMGGNDETGTIQGIVDLDGERLVQLTRHRPELAEYLALEIQNMKLRRSSEADHVTR